MPARARRPPQPSRQRQQPLPRTAPTIARSIWHPRTLVRVRTKGAKRLGRLQVGNTMRNRKMRKSILAAAFGAVLASGFLVAPAPAAHAWPWTSICDNIDDYSACSQQLLKQLDQCITNALGDYATVQKCENDQQQKNQQLENYTEQKEFKLNPPPPNTGPLTCPNGGTPGPGGWCAKGT